MNRLLKIFDTGKEQKLLDMLYGSSGDCNKAITILHKDVQRYCRSTGQKLGFCPDETDDLLGEVMLAFLEARREKKIKKNPAGYLKRMIRFKSIDKLNKKKELAFVSLEQIELSTVEDDKNKESKQLTETAMNKMCNAMKHLSSNQQTLINCYYILKMSLKEIAVEQNTTPEVIKTQLSRARKALRDKLREL